MKYISRFSVALTIVLLTCGHVFPQGQEDSKASRSSGLRKISGPTNPIDVDIDIDEAALEQSIDLAVEQAMKSVDIVLDNLDIRIPPIDIDLSALDVDIDPIEVNIPDFDFRMDPIDLEIDHDFDIDIDSDDWDDESEFDKQKSKPDKDKADKDKQKDKSGKDEKAKGLKKIN